MIRERHYSPEYAVSRVLRRYAKVFQALESSYLAERANDIFDIEKRLLRNLLGQRREELVAAHLARGRAGPQPDAQRDGQPRPPASCRGFATEIGGPGSHTAIVAEGMEIPAVVGIGPFLTDVSGGDMVIIDGDQGLVILTRRRDARPLPARGRGAPHAGGAGWRRCATCRPRRWTACGSSCWATSSSRTKSQHCLERGGDGIGLYRTEFLYLGADAEPTEEDHYEAYAEVLQAMGGKPVVIRTLDLGADKMAAAAARRRTSATRSWACAASGCRCATCRCSARSCGRSCGPAPLGDVRIMFPLITTLCELRQAKMVLADVMEDLEEHGIAFNRDVPVGMMVEVPAAVMMIDHFVRGGRLSQHRHQRPDPVHAGRRPQQQGRGRPVQRRPTRRCCG